MYFPLCTIVHAVDVCFLCFFFTFSTIFHTNKLLQAGAANWSFVVSLMCVLLRRANADLIRFHVLFGTFSVVKMLKQEKQLSCKWPRKVSVDYV